MKTKLTQFIPALFMFLAIGFLYVSRWCTETIPSCYGSWMDRIYFYFTQPLYFFSLYSIPLVIILIFVSRTVFKSWFRLSTWMLPIAFIFIATQPVNWMGIGINPFFISRDDMARYVAEIFTALSLILIIWKYIALRRSARQTLV